MRVILVHNNFSIQGGAEVFVREVARVLVMNGHDVAYFCAYEEGVSVEYSKFWPSAVDYKNRSLFSSAIRFGKMIYNIDSKKNLSRMIDKFRPDIIHCFSVYTKLTPSVLDAAYDKNIPVVMSCNDYKHICPNYKLYHHGKLCESCKGGSFFYAIKNRCLHNSFSYSLAACIESYVHHTFLNIYRKRVKKFLFASRFMANKTVEFWGGEFSWSILRNPFDTAKYFTESCVGNYVLYFGRMIEEKGVNVLIDAASLKPDIEFILVGDGPDRRRLESACYHRGVSNIRFVGEIWGEGLTYYLANCRCVVVPSLWHENFPYVILQAFAAGKLVIGSDRGGIPELLDYGRRGMIYDADDPDELATCIERVFSLDNWEIERLGGLGKNYVISEFNDTVFYEKLIGVYEEVVS